MYHILYALSQYRRTGTIKNMFSQKDYYHLPRYREYFPKVRDKP